MMRSFAVHCLRISVATALFGSLAVGCIDPESDLIKDSSEGCDEINSEASTQSVDVDPAVKEFMLASTDLSKVAQQTAQDVLTACGKIASDLGVADSWSALPEANRRISNADGTGACDQAVKAVDAKLPAEARLNIAIDYAKGYCYVEYTRQVECDKKCTTEQTCEPGPVETRCEPGSLSVQCDGACAVGACCVGTKEVSASCKGTCEAECKGECRGTCVHADGTKSENEVNCAGKCAGFCAGSCSGRCTIEESAGVACGAHARCEGGCTSTFTEPVCVTEYGPPKCAVEESCENVCTAHLWANPVCVPSTVSVRLDASASGDLTPVRATLEANLPALIDAAEHRGKQAMKAINRLSDASSGLRGRADNLTGKSLACVAESSTLLGTRLDSIKVSVDASVRLTSLCQERTL